ncbi:MAG TPA: TlpA disulfide reductase family protein [Thermoanaerobaculia bacterium]|jgi:thiol-disulfide isomerase/thioredoxin
MRRFLAFLFEVLCDVPVVALSLIGTDVLLQSRSLAYALFPLLTAVGVALGFWRGRASALPSWQLAALLGLPLLASAFWFRAESGWALAALPLLALLSVALGLAVVRVARTGWSRTAAALVPLLILNLALLPAVPRLISSLVSSRRVDEPAPPYRLIRLDGGAVAAEQLRGRVVVLDFWAVWCTPCRRELPEIERVHARFARRPDVAFFAVDGAQGDTPEQARQYFRDHGYRLDLAYDDRQVVQTSLSVHGYPTLLVLDRAGRIRLRHVGFLGAEELAGKLTGLIEMLLAESPAASGSESPGR